MADSNSPVGVSIPGSGQRRKKAYSVSLHDKTFDISEVPCDDDLSIEDDEKTNQTKGKCQMCGQKLPKRTKSIDQFENNLCNLSFESHGSHNRNVRAQVGDTTATKLDYESVTSSNDNSTQGNGLDHCHGVQFAKPNDQAKKRLITASILCLIFMVGEIAGGYLANSLAIATDAAHLLTDFASFMISLFSLWVATRPPTKKMSFGWYRAEVIGALTSVLMIWVVTGVLVYLAIQRLISMEFDIDVEIMLITSGIGVVINILMGFTLHQHGHSHGASSHSHGSSNYSDPESQPLLTHSHSNSLDENINVRAAFIHVVGDLVQSIGVFIAALVIYFKPSWTIVDPICTFLFSILVLLTTVAILKDALTVLMEGLPRGLDFNSVQEAFLSIEGVTRVHNLRIWALSMEKTALAAHLAVHPGVKTQQVLLRASRLVRSRFNVFEMTLQIEEFDIGMEDCTQCQDPLD